MIEDRSAYVFIGPYGPKASSMGESQLFYLSKSLPVTNFKKGEFRFSLSQQKQIFLGIYVT